MDTNKLVVVLLVFAIIFSVVTLVIGVSSVDSGFVTIYKETTTIDQGVSGDITLGILENGDNGG